jgi:hypothetical protein
LLDSDCHHFACRTAVNRADATAVVRYALGQDPVPAIAGARVLQGRRVGPTGRLAFSTDRIGCDRQGRSAGGRGPSVGSLTACAACPGSGWTNDLEVSDASAGGQQADRADLARQLEAVAGEAETGAARARALPKAPPARLQSLAVEVQASLEKLLAIGESTRATHALVTYLRHETDSIAAADLAAMARAQAAAYAGTATRARALADRLTIPPA